jgi:hypothetical protein
MRSWSAYTYEVTGLVNEFGVYLHSESFAEYFESERERWSLENPKKAKRWIAKTGVPQGMEQWAFPDE